MIIFRMTVKKFGILAAKLAKFDDQDEIALVFGGGSLSCNVFEGEIAPPKTLANIEGVSIMSTMTVKEIRNTFARLSKFNEQNELLLIQETPDMLSYTVLENGEVSPKMYD